MIRCILTDIEGTTSSISFVKDVLFPYERALPEFLAENNEQPTVHEQITSRACGDWPTRRRSCHRQHSAAMDRCRPQSHAAETLKV